MSAIAAFLSASVTTTHRQSCALVAVGACWASAMHSRITAGSTGRSKSRRRRTARVVESSSSVTRVSNGVSIPVPSVPRDLAPGRVGVEPRLTRETEHPLADDVHLDLGGAAGDRGGLRAAERQHRVVVAACTLVDLPVGVRL